jgi:hypothetical protein
MAWGPFVSPSRRRTRDALISLPSRTHLASSSTEWQTPWAGISRPNACLLPISSQVVALPCVYKTGAVPPLARGGDGRCQTHSRISSRWLRLGTDSSLRSVQPGPQIFDHAVRGRSWRHNIRVVDRMMGGPDRIPIQLKWGSNPGCLLWIGRPKPIHTPSRWRFTNETLKV